MDLRQIVAEVDWVHTVLSVHSGAGCTVLPRSGLAAYGKAFRLQVAAIVAPTIRNRLVLALPRTRPQTRLVRETAALLALPEFAVLDGQSRALARSAASG